MCGLLVIGFCQSGVWKKAQGGSNYGTFQIAGLGGCAVGNPLTGGCSCPAGSTASLAYVAYLNGFWSVKPDYMYVCW